MASGERSTIWFAEVVALLRESWRSDLSWAEVVALVERLQACLDEIRRARSIEPPTFTCHACGVRGPGAAPRISVRAALLSLKRFRIEPPDVVLSLERSWTRYRKSHELDLYGKPAADVNGLAPGELTRNTAMTYFEDEKPRGRWARWIRYLFPPRAGSAPSTTPEERVAAALAREIATHGEVRPPWVYAPGHDPWSITWRMGDESYLLWWASWVHDHPRSEVAALIRRYGAVPALWAPWAAAVACELTPSQREPTFEDEEPSIFHEPFEVVRALLASEGIEVSGEPSPPATLGPERLQPRHRERGRR